MGHLHHNDTDFLRMVFLRVLLALFDCGSMMSRSQLQTILEVKLARYGVVMGVMGEPSISRS